MTRFRTLALIGTLALAFAACADEAPTAGEKPAADPDQALGNDKADTLTNWYVDQQGFFALDTDNKAAIDYPSWFHGHLVELEAGQTIDVTVTAQARSIVRLYGPSYGMWGDEYLFSRSVARTRTRRDGDITSAQFDVEVEEDGVYMLVIGPTNVWSTEYKWRASCVAGCEDDVPKCEEDDECDEGEFCGHNGVVCITTPCDVSFNICQPQVDAGGSCHRDGVCAEGLSCIDDVCAEATADCKTDDDCDDGWCGCADGSCTVRECRAWTGAGGGCGGHVMPQHLSRCAPGMQCIGRGLAYDAPGVCAITVTVDQLTDDPKAFNGKFVATEGHVEAPWAICTQMACGFDNPCCNSCGREQSLFADTDAINDGNGITLMQDGETWRCGGNNCTWQDNCTVETGSYWLGGKFVIGDYEALNFEVEHYWSL